MIKFLDKSSDFSIEKIDLTNMKDVSIKVILLGDGMSGKTQILIALGKMLNDYLKDLYRHYFGVEDLEDERRDEDTFSVKFYRWTKENDFLIEYGDDSWDLTSISLDIETIGLEDFCFTFPYLYNDKTYRIKLIGNDLGGQNIFDHFRAVLGKIALPEDNMVIVFDKSRKLSCYNSIQHIKEVTGELAKEEWHSSKILPRLWYVGNKIDLEEHIKAKQWKERISQSLAEDIQTSTAYTLPSLIHPEKKERIISYEAFNDTLSFPDVEALIYNAIRTTDITYDENLMSDVNARALAREITSQLIYLQKSSSMENGKIDHQGDWWRDFSNHIFNQRPLALQYTRTTGIMQTDDFLDDSLDQIRRIWTNYCLKLPLPPEVIENAIIQTGKTDEILTSMGGYFSTNAILGYGVNELLKAIILKSLKDNESKGLKTVKEPSRRRIKRF